MAYYAFLDENNIVTEVIKGEDETVLIDGKTPEVWYSEFRGVPCVRTSYNGTIRYNYAAIGFVWDSSILPNGAFYAPQPYPSWTLDSKCQWQAPVPYPEDGLTYVWDEENQNWILYT
jgi:hypothetical protein